MDAASHFVPDSEDYLRGLLDNFDATSVESEDAAARRLGSSHR
jgi:hypothetical protein